MLENRKGHVPIRNLLRLQATEPPSITPDVMKIASQSRTMSLRR
jgi:hypothetical protein